MCKSSTPVLALSLSLATATTVTTDVDALTIVSSFQGRTPVNSRWASQQPQRNGRRPSATPSP
ncbi:hypothetical protein Gbem_3005 [Citrifermentans bemidjiense Bem]|uniref:Uncharacterized protein n=1 Tax=Citrifermentans bemidjiense (strain ATCC BAA-1014 / DSM 16622 / JCM 12645 / Bem) TaxID=404380 RepID=B5E839_CITBB|nr:hypothetical protein Gbem_3005 [Citrifermentans bemidjiense Bem]